MSKHFLTLFLFVTIVHSLKAQTADFTFNSSNGNFCDPNTITFTQACTGNPIGFIWNFGNNQRGIHPVETMTYYEGTYTITLTALFASSAVSVTKTININPTPFIALDANTNYLCKPGTVAFTATASSFITGYEWNFGDGSPVENTTTNNISHAYPTYGNYTTSVKVVSAAGCSDTANYEIRVNKFAINGTMSVTNGCIPAVPDFTVTADLPPGDGPFDYLWDFGDGSGVISSEVGNIAHRYTTTSTINTANVSITSVQGCNNRYSFPAFAFGTPPTNLNARTAIPKDTFCASEIIRFSGTAIDANAYLWQFGDSSEANIPDSFTTHQYRKLGPEMVKATPLFNGCPGLPDSMQIFVKGVIADCIHSNLCSNKKAYAFTNSSKGNITHFDWEFSDNPGLKDSTNFNVTHTFPTSGSFKASLFLFDNSTGCTDEVDFNIYTAVPSFSRNINSVCKDSAIEYKVANSYPADAGFTYDFYVNGNTVSNGGDPVLKYNPSIHGSFAEYVVINDGFPGTCSDTIELNGNTIVKGPVVDFSTEDSRCFGLPFNFTNNSYPFFPAESIIHWQWTFGDNTEDTVRNPGAHLYTEASSRRIVLTATDLNGCAQSMQTTVVPIPLPEIIAFPAVDTICGQRDTAVLRAYTIDTLLWMPSTNISCNSCDTTRVNPSVTTSYVAQATNKFGCRSYDTCIVKVYGPINLKVFPSDTAVCPGQSISFRTLSSSENISWIPATYLNKANVANPSSMPAADISYKVFAKDAVGCYEDSVTVNTRVHALPTVDAGSDKVLPYNAPFSITPIYSPEVASYLWEPSANLTCANCPSISGNAVTTQTYTIKTTSVNGCKSSDQVTIAITCDKSTMFMPTAFTPNGDGLNEYFYPAARGYRNIKSFVIFNRRGNKVFERKDFAPNIASLGWDGIIKGAETVSSSETFGWYLEAECEQGYTVTNKGTVVLVR